MPVRSSRIVSMAGQFDRCEVRDVLNDGCLTIRPFGPKCLAEQDICLIETAKPHQNAGFQAVDPEFDIERGVRRGVETDNSVDALPPANSQRLEGGIAGG